MRKRYNLNQEWHFHLGELDLPPKKIAKKAYAFGGLTASLPEEGLARLPISGGGIHFLKLIAQGDTEIGLRNLCATDLYSQLDDSWKVVNLPHDWKVELPYEDNPMNLMSGSKPDGIGYYRKRFPLSTDDSKGKRIVLHFDGVTRMADIWLNGAYLGHNNSGYTAFEFDITDMSYFDDEGDNTLLVRAETTSGSEGWWYEGAGIYKDVYIEVLPELHLVEEDFYVYTKSLENGGAVLGVELSVQNEGNLTQQVQPQIEIAGNHITFDTEELKPLGNQVFEGEITLSEVQLWSPETPILYQARVTIEGDQLIKDFGIRTFAYDTSGFYLNGNPYELHGVCEHQDFAGVGAAMNQDILDYKIKIMKEMGVNAYRSAHHFASKELLEACDKYGILVMNENRLPEASPWRVDNLIKMVKRSRMNASIAFWSIGNEELTGNTPFGSRTVKRFAQAVRAIDKEHLLISAELLSPEGFVDEEYLTHFDILGVNYPEAGVMGAGAEIIHENHPGLPMMSTENASYFSSRGIYKDDEDRCRCNNFGSMYSMILPGKRQPGDPGVGGTARPEEVIAYLKSHSYMGGVFIWTAFDYFGEPSPFAFPGIGSQFGICDVNGLPKDYYYYYQAQWTDKPMVHVMPHWDKEGLEIDASGQTPVRVFSNADSVELFINGESQGLQQLDDCQANYKVSYQPGELKVIAYKEGKVVAEDRQVTSSAEVSLQQDVLFTGQETDLIAISAVDENGNLVNLSEEVIEVKAEKGTVIGLGNGDPADISDFSLADIKLFSGRAVAIVKHDKEGFVKISTNFESVK